MLVDAGFFKVFYGPDSGRIDTVVDYNGLAS